MAEKQCESCAALNSSVNNDPRNPGSPSKTADDLHPDLFADDDELKKSPKPANAWAESQQHNGAAIGNNDAEKSGESEKDEEKGEESGPPAPVGFFHSSLSKVRLEVFGLWARMGESTILLKPPRKGTVIFQTNDQQQC